MRRGLMLVAVVLLSSPALAVADDLPVPREPEILPVPRGVEAPPPVLWDVPVRPKFESRDVWRSFGVDRRGYARPRVILAPGGAYYYHTGEPYPWVTNNPRAFLLNETR